ncbi:uncharacterized protein LOC134233665 [Saccostrea cucullata]|uniref:uncharacterized protein LOC134233665 n=1 Tax=Saccostrea cuccullata TaxID=36930 RepID=UPI002ED31599
MAALSFFNGWIFFSVINSHLKLVESCWPNPNFTMIPCDDVTPSASSVSNFQYGPFIGVFGFCGIVLAILIFCCKKNKPSSHETTNICQEEMSPTRTDTVNNGLPVFGYPIFENPIFGQYNDHEQHAYCLPAPPRYEEPPKYSTLPRHTSLPENMPPPPEYDSLYVSGYEQPLSGLGYPPGTPQLGCDNSSVPQQSGVGHSPRQPQPGLQEATQSGHFTGTSQPGFGHSPGPPGGSTSPPPYAKY